MKKQAGFTLIELIVVIVLLGILAVTVLPRYQDLTPTARQAVRDGAEAGLKAARGIEIARKRGVNPTVTELAAAMDPAGTALATGITIPNVFQDDGTTLHTFRTYTDSGCATATAAVGDLVGCVQE
jgi:MSHA pilin protein MshA